MTKTERQKAHELAFTLRQQGFSIPVVTEYMARQFPIGDGELVAIVRLVDRAIKNLQTPQGGQG